MNNLSRRELLAAFLGLPVAIAGCQRQDTIALPPGKLVGASAGIGHRLRDGLQITVPEDRWEETGIAIIGGGMAGLSAARRLLQAGYDDFVILELEPKPGGTSRSGSSKIVPYPWGAHYLPAPPKENRALVELLQELNVFEGTDDRGDPVVAEQFLCRDPQERVFYKGRWYEGLYLRAGASDDDLQQLARFESEIDRWVGWRDGDGRRAFALPMATGSDDAEVTALDHVTMAEWLDVHRFTSPRLRWLIDYACRDDYGLRSHQTSAWAGLFYFASRIREPGEDSRPFMTWPEGNGRIVEHLHKPVAKRTRLGAAVAEVIPTAADGETGVEVIAVNHDGSTANGFRAQRAIFAAPHFLAPYLIRTYREERAQHTAEFEYGAWAVANLTLKDRPIARGFAPAWDNVLYDSPSLGYVSATHQRGLDYGPTVLTYYYPLCGGDARADRERLLNLGRDEWAEVALADLERAHPDIREQAERVDVMRWGHAMIRPRPGFVWGAARRKAAEPYRGIHFAHSDLSGVALFEEAFYRGIHAAEDVLMALGRDVETKL